MRPTETCLIPPRHQDQPLLGGRRLGLDGLVQRVLPVVERKRRDLLRFDGLCCFVDLGSGGILGLVGQRCRRPKVAEKVLELGLVLREWALGGRGQDW